MLLRVAPLKSLGIVLSSRAIIDSSRCFASARLTVMSGYRRFEMKIKPPRLSPLVFRASERLSREVACEG